MAEAQTIAGNTNECIQIWFVSDLDRAAILSAYKNNGEDRIREMERALC